MESRIKQETLEEEVEKDSSLSFNRANQQQPQLISTMISESTLPHTQHSDCSESAFLFPANPELTQSPKPIVAIDGPAGAGKSTVARQVAQRLGLLHLDTGAFYRALTWQVLQLGLSTQDEVSIAELAGQVDIQLVCSDSPQAPQRVYINQQDVTQVIRSLEVTAIVPTIAAQPAVRQSIVQLQHYYGRQGGLVAEGRDIGTKVFPNAELKIFLTASVEERARRRQRDLLQQGNSSVDLETIETTIRDRDHKDFTRAVSPLRQAEDAIVLHTDDLEIEAVIEQVINLYYERVSVVAVV